MLSFQCGNSLPNANVLHSNSFSINRGIWDLKEERKHLVELNCSSLMWLRNYNNGQQYTGKKTGLCLLFWPSVSAKGVDQKYIHFAIK